MFFCSCWGAPWDKVRPMVLHYNGQWSKCSRSIYVEICWWQHCFRGQEYDETSNIQAAVDSLSRQSLLNDFQLNESKCEQIRVYFAKKQPTKNPVELKGKPLEVVSKIVGLNTSNDLKWNGHISELVKKPLPTFMA